MEKGLNIAEDEKLKERSEKFTKNLSSTMYYQAELTSDSMVLDWLKQIEFSCPYIDDLVRHPKLDLINEEDIVKIQEARRVSVVSVKHLSKHTSFIEKVDPVTQDVRPSKILIERREEAYNTYENRMVYTLMFNMGKLIAKKESLLEDLKTKNDKVLEYAGTTSNDNERINVKFTISSKQMSGGDDFNEFYKEIEGIKLRIKSVKRYLSSWRTSEFFRSLAKAAVPFVYAPIKKTNVLLSNTNYNTALTLFEYLDGYDDNNYNSSKDRLDTSGDEILKGIIDDSFLMDYFVMDSICASKKEQKSKLSRYAVIMINQQLKRLISLLLNSGIDLLEEEILKMVSVEISNEKRRRLVGSNDVKNKFKEAMEKYFEGTQDFL